MGELAGVHRHRRGDRPVPDEIVAFTEQTGNNVNYQESILDNADFIRQILPDLSNGNNTGWDLITPGGWVVQRMADLGFLEEIDHSKLPNWTANAADYAVGQWFDPDNTYSLWWQGGITGIAYDPRPRDASSRASRTCSTPSSPAGSAASATCATCSA